MTPRVPEPQGDNVGDARVLRARLTRSEERLWRHLRDRQFENLKFRRQHPIRNFVVDFYCATARLVVEIDGGVHRTAEQVARDQSRQAALEAMGYRVLRIPSNDVDRAPESALARISEAAIRAKESVR